MAMQRFRVAGHSMSPTLHPGQEVVTVDTRTPEPGDLVVFEHPGQAGMWLVKRLADRSGRIVSDNPDDSSNDSRTIGDVPIRSLLPIVERLDAETFVEGCELLASEDEHLAALVETWGIPEFWHRRPGFETLVLLILEQQVSLESGAAMYRRLTELTRVVTPEAVVAAGEQDLRAIGVTRQKTSYLLDLSELVASGDLDLERLDDLPTAEARGELTRIRGIGAWTADAYLLSAQRRPDMWPVGDRALQVGTGEALGLSGVPTEADLELIGEPWRPVRAIAARLIWHAYLGARGRVEPPDPTHGHGTTGPA